MVDRRIQDALQSSILDPGEVPSTGPELVRFAGGRAALTRQLSGMSGAPRRGQYADEQAYKAARTRWRSAARRAQRYDEQGKEGKQTRGRGRVVLSPAQAARTREAAEDRKLSRLLARGMRARLKARLVVPSPKQRGKRDDRVRTVPSGGPGVLIAGEVVAEILGDVEDGNEDRAAGRFMAAFFDAYGAPDLWIEPGENVMWLKMWPEGEPEPPGD